MKKPQAFIIAALIIGAAFFAGAVRADLEIIGDTSFWWVIQEQNENGILQIRTMDEAAREASGFNFKRARLSVLPSVPQYHLYSKFQAEFSQTVNLLDAWASFQPLPLFGLYVGQMKIPSTYEVLTDEYHLDFITRTQFSQRVVNYSLATSTYESPLTGMDSHLRDVGLGFKGSWDAGQKWDVVNYFLMAGNGLGANLGISNKESPGFMVSNNFGDYLYAGRLEIAPLQWVRLGGHYDYNVHKNMLFRDRVSVFDLDRTSWSTDLSLTAPWSMRVLGMYGQGVIADDWLTLDKKDYQYTGWEVRVLQGFFNNRLELAVRFDTYVWETNESGQSSHEDHWTYGINWNPVPQFRAQLNYITKTSVIPFEKDLNDNIVFLNLEAQLDTILNPELLKKK